MAEGDRLITVCGAIDPAHAGTVDAHNHVWIAPVAGALPGAPVLAERSCIEAELIDYRRAGGGTIVDCQPNGCGRDGRMLAELARSTGIAIIACTGFHLAKYYPPNHWLWEASSEQAARYFLSELETTLLETNADPNPARAGFVKIACPARLVEISGRLLEAAAAAARQSGAALAVHTEQGGEADQIVDRLGQLGLLPARLVLFHVDKRPDLGLHRELAQSGVLLEYDTFYRPKYNPETGVWPLIEQMVAAGLDGQIAIGTDMADAGLWVHLGNGEVTSGQRDPAPGLAGLLTRIVPHLQKTGFDLSTIRRLTGENITRRLARRTEPYHKRSHG